MEDVPLGQVSIKNMADMLDEYLCSGEILPLILLVLTLKLGKRLRY